MADNSGPFKILWPEIDDATSAKAAANLGAFGAGLFALITAGVVTYRALQAPSASPALAGYIEAAIYALLAFGIWRLWRAAAVIAFILFLAEQVVAGIHAHAMVGFVMPSLLTLFLISGVRGTFLFNKYSRLEVPGADV
jgi:hypothetical protein